VAKTPRRKPNQAEPKGIAVVVTYGDKISTFLITNENAGTKIEFNATGERPRTKVGAPKDWTYLNGRISAMTGPSNDPKLCPRTNVLITRGTQQIFGCLTAPNPLATQMRKLVNLLALYI
jgi:hypothetical protein